MANSNSFHTDMYIKGYNLIRKTNKRYVKMKVFSFLKLVLKKSLRLNTTPDFSPSPLLLLKVPLDLFHNTMGGSTKHKVPMLTAQWFPSEAPFSPVPPQACLCCRGMSTLAPGAPPALLLPCPGSCRAVPCLFPSLPGSTLPRMKPVSFRQHQQHWGLCCALRQGLELAGNPCTGPTVGTSTQARSIPVTGSLQVTGRLFDFQMLLKCIDIVITSWQTQDCQRIQPKCWSACFCHNTHVFSVVKEFNTWEPVFFSKAEELLSHIITKSKTNKQKTWQNQALPSSPHHTHTYTNTQNKTKTPASFVGFPGGKK